MFKVIEGWTRQHSKLEVSELLNAHGGSLRADPVEPAR